MLEARAVGYREILQSVSLSLGPSSVLGLVGPNGAGKTTLIRALAGLIRIDGGSVELDGRRVDLLPRREVARRIAVVFQETPPVVGFRVRDVVSMGRFPHVSAWTGPSDRDAAMVERAMESAGVQGLADRPHQQLSGGEQQLVQLARALAQEPSVLLMDEPAANLDVRHQRALGDRLRRLAQEGLAILVSTHDMNSVLRWCDRVVLMSEGKVSATGTPAEVLSRERVGEVFGVLPDVASLPDGRKLFSF